MQKVAPEQWQPVGVKSLEMAADEVVRLLQNSIVIANPGAGKTELLAQRACFLLQTGVCLPPHRILAISFKRDAAKNLKERVQRRCGELGKYFDSFTLDAFAKSLIDRFLPALSDQWRPKLGYEIMVRTIPVEDKRVWLIHECSSKHLKSEIESWPDHEVNTIFDKMSHGEVLPYKGKDVSEEIRHWGLRWWREQLNRPPGRPSLTFPMLNRLAAHLLRENPKITKALQITYRFVFLDEFQDTTAAQYDLITTAFKDSTSLLTAVGDRKQRIMLWAGAMPNVFEVFESDFNAIPKHLVNNYRSAPELVQMQHVIAQTIEFGSLPAMPTKTDVTGSCILMEFSTPEEEAAGLAEVIAKELKEGKSTRDICVLVRQRTADMIAKLKGELEARDIQLRDESQLQDLLAEPLVKFLLAILRLTTRSRDPEAWEELTSELRLLYGSELDDETSEIEKESKRFIEHAKNGLAAGKTAATLLPELIDMVGNSKIRSVYRQYGAGSYMKGTIDGLSEALQTYIEASPSIKKAVDDLIGTDVIPAMTIHKSKGLEFRTVIFLGLEDSQWWAFASQPEEEKRGFFVAFSRAIENVIFTFSEVRIGRFGRQRQRKSQIDDLYAILQRAGIKTIDFRK